MSGQNLRNRLRQSGRTGRELAAFMSRELNYPVSERVVSSIVNGQRNRLSVEENAAIEAFFKGGEHFDVPVDRSAPRGGSRKIPLYGFVAAGSLDGVAYSSDSVLDEIEAPIHNVDAAFRVAGASMEPRLFAGETVFVKLGVTPRRGDDCVVEMADEKQGVLIKTYQQSKDGFVFLAQWNPSSEIRLKASDVRAIHAVRLRA